MASFAEAAVDTAAPAQKNAGHAESYVVSSGVPAADVPTVMALSVALNLDPVKNALEPMCDPLTLLRFCNAREGDVEKAAHMYREAMAWRQSSNLCELMKEYGSLDTEYLPDGTRATDAGTWNWSRLASKSEDSAFVQKIGFFGRLRDLNDEDAPIIIWRMGAVDLNTAKTNQALLLKAFATHMEDAIQAGRAASLKHKRLIRARLIIDLNGLGLTSIPYLSILRPILGLGKSYYPEATASATLINAPWVFSKIWVLIKPMLTAVMQAKVSILGSDWEEGFRAHSLLERRQLPKMLGGEAADEDICECQTL
jgi:hypothetical protein